MARKVKYTVTGIRKIDRLLQKVKTSEGKKVIRKAMRDNQKTILKKAKASAPVGKSRQLRKSIKLKAAKRSTVVMGLYVRQYPVGTEGDKGYLRGFYQEYGTKKRNKLKAKRFMRDSYASLHRQVRKKTIQDITSGLRKYIKTHGA